MSRETKAIEINSESDRRDAHAIVDRIRIEGPRMWQVIFAPVGTFRPPIRKSVCCERCESGLANQIEGAPTIGRTEIIFIPWRGYSLNRIWSGVKWKQRQRSKQIAHAAVIDAVKASDIQPFPGPVSLEFRPQHLQGQRRLDCTNYAPSIKAVEDGLVQAGTLSGDSCRHVISVKTLVAIRGAEKGIYVRIIEET